MTTNRRDWPQKLGLHAKNLDYQQHSLLGLFLTAAAGTGNLIANLCKDWENQPVQNIYVHVYIRHCFGKRATVRVAEEVKRYSTWMWSRRVITINEPVDYMARAIMILMRGKDAGNWKGPPLPIAQVMSLPRIKIIRGSAI